MKKLFTILVLLLLTTMAVNAQTQSTAPGDGNFALYQPGIKNQMRDFQKVLALDRPQMQQIKDHFTQSSTTERQLLATLTGTFQIENAKIEFRNQRDAFVRSILTEEQVPAFNEYILNRAQNAPAPGGTVGSGLGGGR